MNESNSLPAPPSGYRTALDRAAEAWGVEREYWDIFGKQHTASPEVLQAILKAFGVDVSSEAALDQALEARLWDEWSRAVPQTLVTSEDGLLRLRLPRDHADSDVEIDIAWEEGGVDAGRYSLAAIPANDRQAARGEEFVEKRLQLSIPLRLGYHTLTCRTQGGEFQSRLIVGPDRAWLPDELRGNGTRAAGIVVSLYGLRSERNWGCGDITDLRAFTDWSADSVGAGFVGLNPLHAIHNRTPYNTSPYLPNCTYYRNFIYLDVESVPEFSRSRRAREILADRCLQGTIARLRAKDLVEYEEIARLKLRFLKLLFREFLAEYRQGGPRAQDFRRWADCEGELLLRFATYCALDEVLHKQNRDLWLWTDWPEKYQDPHSPAVAQFQKEHWRLVLFYQYVQWELDRQLAEAQEHAKRRGMPIGLYHDLALATDRFGSDLWAYRRYFVHGARVGAPPDDFSPNGQDWSFPPPNSHAHREDGYRHFANSIRKAVRHGGALRIDHVMRFFRLFWIPEGLTAAQGTYVREPAEEHLRVLALESVRNRFMVVGEDLGTVEPEFRQTLARFGMLSYRLLYFEKHPDGRFRLPEEYPKQALVSPTTHDLPTIAGFWEGRDIEARRAAGVLDEQGHRHAWEDRLREKQRLLDTLHSLGLLPSWTPRSAAELPSLTGELHNAFIGFVAQTPSLLLAINQEDLTKETEQQNLPGTTAEYPNWRRKMRYTVEQLRTAQQPRDFTAMLVHWLERTGRRTMANR
ncbi:MAG: 4-alpha-glucanotransferase [Bryobacteraceae bacterium]|nr:4-alpha-glucanotransferase [Bryobacteraceae bacterium]